MPQYVKNYKVDSKIEVHIDPTKWKELTSQTGIKASLKSLVGRGRGPTLQKIDKCYEAWYEKPNDFLRTFALNIQLNHYIRLHGGIKNVDRNSELISQVERLTRYAYLRQDQPESLETAIQSESIQAAADQYYYDFIAWPNARRDIVMLFANINLKPVWEKEFVKLLTLGVSTAVATETRGGDLSLLDNKNKADSYAKMGGQGLEMAQKMGGTKKITDTLSEKLMRKSTKITDPKQFAKDHGLVVYETEPVDIEKVIEGVQPLDTSAEVSVAVPPEIAANQEKISRWTQFWNYIKTTFKAIASWLWEKLKKQFSSVSGAMDVIFGLTNVIMQFAAKNAAPLVGAGLQLTQDIVNAVTSTVQGYKLATLSREALPLSGTMSELVQAFRSQASTDAKISGLYSVLSSVKVAAEVMTAGATIFVNMIIEAARWLIATVHKVLEARKMKAFISQMQELWSSDKAMGRDKKPSPDSDITLEPNDIPSFSLNFSELKDDDTKGFLASKYKETLVVADANYSFKHLFVTACQTSILLPSLILMSGILETHGPGVMFQYSYDSDRINSDKEGSPESRLVKELKSEALQYLTKRGFQVTPDIKVMAAQEKERLTFYIEQLFSSLGPRQKIIT